MIADPNHDEPRHPIRVVSERTGVSPTLLRAWERRYGVVEPARSSGGQRLYSDADVDRILLLRQVTDAGRSIGNVAELGDPELRRLVREDEAARERREAGTGEGLPSGALDAALRAVEELDPEGLETLLRRELVTLGGERFLEGLVAPLLVRIGERWRQGSVRPAHEHVAVAVVKQVLGWMLDRARRQEARRTVVVGTLSGERHELGALLAAAAAALEGWRPVLTGEDLPPEEIALAAESVGASAVGISVVSPDDWSALEVQARSLLDSLSRDTRLILGGAGGATLARLLSDVRVRVAPSLSGFRDTLREIDPAP